MTPFPLAIVLAVLAASAAFAAKPNVLIVMTDDQGLGDFSYTGNPVVKTPNLDAFAKEAVRFTDFHVTPMCSPTRGQLMTGLAALRNGATWVTAGRTFLRRGLPTVPEAFGKAGYRTGIFGKWHLGDHFPHRPMDRGFQECVHHLGWGQFDSVAEFDWPLIDGRYFHNGVQKRYKGHCTDFWFDSAMAWMKKCKDDGKPFFCYLATNAPHEPHVELEKYVAPYRKAKQPAAFFGMIAHVDERFGGLEKFLVEQKLRDDTIVIFMTDNGGTEGVNVFNAGLRGKKTNYYEGGHRVPCWVRWPNGKFGKPRDVSVPTQNIDLFPTLCELCGVPGPKRAKADEMYCGTSLAGLLRGARKELPDRKFVVQYGKIVKKYESCVVWGKWRLVKGAELYDIGVDRAQKVDVATKHAEVVKAMRDHYEAWWKGLPRNDFVCISIGAMEQPVVELTSADWVDDYADETRHVRMARSVPTGGPWHIQVERAGEYEITLRRWPEHTKGALGAKPAGDTAKETKTFPNIAGARIEVAGVRAGAKAGPRATAATITAKLSAGRTTLKAWFTDAEGKGLCGAFFVTVKRK
jgi:arylsulfatase